MDTATQTETALPFVHLQPDADALSRAAATRWVALCQEAVAARGTFHTALAGGSTPRRLYELLAGAEFAGQVDWGRVHVWFGDERSVPPDHPDSNYHMARTALLDHVPVPGTHVHPIFAAPATIRQDAAVYRGELVRNAPLEDGIPCLDLVMLGIGPDGHTASLFPHTCILREDRRSVAAVYVPRLHTWRISLTFPVLNRARHVMFLVAGAEKAPIIARVLGDGDTGNDDDPLPVQMLRPRGTVEWYLDPAAAAGLETA